MEVFAILRTPLKCTFNRALIDLNSHLIVGMWGINRG